MDPELDRVAQMTAIPDRRPTGVHQTRIEWIDTDAAGIYHNSGVIRFVEAAEATLMREHGLSGYFPVAPRVRFEANYVRPLQFGQAVTTTVELERLGTASMTFAFEVWGEEFDDRPRKRAAFGNYTTVHISGSHADSSAKSVPWPPEWRQSLTPTPGRHG